MRKDICDVWFPNLSPIEDLLREGRSAGDETAWNALKRKFQAKMKSPGPKRDLDLLAALSHQANFAIGCYCEDESRCHRPILKQLLEKWGTDVQ